MDGMLSAIITGPQPEAEQNAAAQRINSADEPPPEPTSMLGAIMGGYRPRSAREIVQRAQFAGRPWSDTQQELKTEGYAPSDELGVQYEQHRKLTAERDRQVAELGGRQVGTAEQFRRGGVPFLSAVANRAEAQDAFDATERFKAGKATDEDIKVLARAQRLEAADKAINSTTAGQLANTVVKAPAIVGEALAGGKIVGALGRATGIGQAAAQTTGRSVLNFAGQQALTTPLMPSLYVEHAIAKNAKEGRDPNDVRGYAPAIGLAYANNLVLGQLQGGNFTGSVLSQAAKKGAVGVAEQMGADVGVSLVDEFLPKAYKTDTRYGVLGQIARGENRDALQNATVQMFTFGYFAAMHGRKPNLPEAYRDFLDKSKDAGLSDREAAAAVEPIHKTLLAELKDRLDTAAGEDFSKEDARKLLADVPEKIKDMPAEAKDAVKRYVDHVVDIFPEKAKAEPKVPLDERADFEPSPANSEADAARRQDSVPNAEAVKAATEPPPAPKDPVDQLTPEDRKALISSLGLTEKGFKDYLKDPTKRNAANMFAQAFLKASEVASAAPPTGIRPPTLPKTQPKPETQPAQSQSLETAPRGGRVHIASYKEPGKSVDHAISMLEKRGSAPLDLQTWQSADNARSQAADGTASFVFDTTNYSGEIHGKTGIDTLKGSKFPLPFDPALHKVVFKGDVTDPKFERLQKAVAEVNRRRADVELMRSFGHEGRLPYLKLEATGKGFGNQRLQRVDAEGHAARRAGEENAPKQDSVPNAEAKPPEPVPAKAGGRTAEESLLPDHLRGKELTADHKAVVDFARGKSPEVRDALKSVLHNMPQPGGDIGAADRKRGTIGAVASQLEAAAKAGDAPTTAALRSLVVKLGGSFHGPAAGENTKFDGRYHQTHDSVFTGDRVRVERQPVTVKEGGTDWVARKGQVTEVKGAGKKAPPRVKSVVDDVIERGGIRMESGGEKQLILENNDKARRPGLFTNDKGAHDLDSMAREMGMEPEELSKALKENHRSKFHDNTDADERALRDHVKREEEAARARGDTGEGWKPSEEDIPFATKPGEPGAKDPSVANGEKGPFEIIAEQNRLFDVRNYVEKGVPYNRDALAVALLNQRATVTSKMAAGDPLVNLEEHAHHLQRALGLSEVPSELPPAVARGTQELSGLTSKVPSRMGMIEGFGEWMKRRATGGTDGLTGDQKAASDYYEAWAKDKGLTENLDKIKAMHAGYAARSEASKAAANVSATGRPAEGDRTKGEIAESVANKAQELVDDNLNVLQRMIAFARSKGNKIGNELYNAYSQLMHAAPHMAAQFERDGIHGYDKDGRKVVLGESWAKIVEGGKKEWLQPGANGEASKAGTYALARHLLGEEARGTTGLVSDAQLEQYRKAMEEFKADKEFAAWAEAFADRLTKANNASLDALASDGVHFYGKDEVARMKEKYPDYVELARVMQDAGWRAGGGAKGEIVGKGIFERSGSGEQIVDPLISYKNRLSKTASRMAEQLKRIELFKVLDMPGMAEWAVMGEESLTRLGEERAKKLKEFGFKGAELKRLMEDMGEARDEEYFTTKPWPTDGTKPTIGMMGVDGKLRTARVGDRALYDLATGQQVEASAMASWLRATGNFYPIKLMTQLVKFGATSASLGFQARNIPRDMFEFWKNTTDRSTVAELPSAYKRAFTFAWAQLTGHFGGKGSTDVLFKRFAADRGEDLRQFDFDRAKPETAYAPNRSKAVETAHSVWGILKDTLRLGGAGELAPRFLEWKTTLQKATGKTEAQLVEMLTAAEKAASEGKHGPDPIPLGVALDAMNAAAEVTVNFNRLGTLTREMNKITPFFGPAIAGMSKQIRNWKDNPKGAAFALAALMGARLLHWSLFSDEDWYKELNANDRYNNFVVPTPAGLRRFPGPRDLDIAAGGLLTLSLDAAAKKNPDVKGYLKQSLEGALPPFPAPPILKTGYQIATNENWQGSPIVPKREEGSSQERKWGEYRAPYAADQLTGGLLSERKVPKEAKDLIPYSEVRNARRSVDEFYDRFHELETARQDAKRQGARFADEAEYQRLEKAQQRIVELGREARGERLAGGKVVKTEPPTSERVAELRQNQIEAARKALGK